MFDQFKVFNENSLAKEEKDKWVLPYSEDLGRYRFVSNKTGIEYAVEDFFLEPVNPMFDDMFKIYKDYASWGNRLASSDVFVLYWLKQMVEINALYHADNLRLRYIEEQTALASPDDRKAPTRISKQSEIVYAEEHAKYLKIHEDK